jgi:hypothetical protein
LQKSLTFQNSSGSAALINWCRTRPKEKSIEAKLKNLCIESKKRFTRQKPEPLTMPDAINAVWLMVYSFPFLFLLIYFSFLPFSFSAFSWVTRAYPSWHKKGPREEGQRYQLKGVPVQQILVMI